MPRKLKVYQARFGFYDSVVAASSQAAALRAWGAHQNLFADGQASVATDADAVALALANPDMPLRRPVGSQEAFSLKPRLPRASDLPDMSRAAKIGSAAKTGSTAKTGSVAKPAAKPQTTPNRGPVAAPAPKPAPPPPDRTALDAAEAALRTLEAEHRRAQDGFASRRSALDVEERHAQTRYGADRAAAERTLTREQQAFARAQGRARRER